MSSGSRWIARRLPTGDFADAIPIGSKDRAAHNDRKGAAMYKPPLHKLLIESHAREVDRVATLRLARQQVATPRPRRWRLRSARPRLAARFAI
jgi:hypothetical protein